MNDSSQVIHNVKKTATRVIQRYLGLLVEERCPDKESWIKEVARIREEACRRKDEEPRYKASYEAVIRQIEHIGLENVNSRMFSIGKNKLLLDKVDRHHSDERIDDDRHAKQNDDCEQYSFYDVFYHFI